MNTPLKDNLGPIVKHTTFVPDYSINKYHIIYIMPDNDLIKCKQAQEPTGTTTTSARSYLYEHGSVVRNNANNNPDIFCEQGDKTFIGWSPNQTSISVPEVIATGHTTLYPIFVDKIPVSVYVFNTQIVQQLFDPNSIVNSDNNQLQTAINNAINNQQLTRFFKFDNSNSTVYNLYTDESCTTPFTSATVVDRLTLYIKADPYVIFTLGDDSSSKTIVGHSEQFIKIPLSELSNSSKTTPSATTTTPHMEFSKWKLITENNSESPYPEYLGENTNQLKNYKRGYSATYIAEFKKKNYNIIFKDTEGNCDPKDVRFTVEAESTISKSNNPQFSQLTCNKVGHTWNGWEKEEFTNYCPAVNLMFYIILAVVIVILIKYIINGFSNSQFGRNILRSASIKRNIF